MINIFGKNFQTEELREVINNKEVYDLLVSASKKMMNSKFDIQKLRRHIDQRVQSLQSIDTFSNYLSKEYEQKDKTEAFHKVEKTFPIQIIARGDGNCFYRSFIVNYILKLTFNQEKEDFFNFILRIHKFDNFEITLEKNNHKFTNEQYKLLSYKFLFDVFMKVKSKQINILSFIQLYNEQPEVDFTLIVICRNFIKKCFQLNNRNPSKQFFIEDLDRKKIPSLLDQYGSEAQDTIISFSANTFNCVLRFQTLYRDKQQKMVTNLDEYKDKKFTPIYVEVLYTGGHYNIILDNQFSSNHCQDIMTKQLQQQQHQTGLLSIVSEQFSKFTGLFKSSVKDSPQPNNDSSQSNKGQTLSNKDIGLNNQDQSQTNNNLSSKIQSKECDDKSIIKNEEKEQKQTVNADSNDKLVQEHQNSSVQNQQNALNNQINDNKLEEIIEMEIEDKQLDQTQQSQQQVITVASSQNGNTQNQIGDEKIINKTTQLVIQPAYLTNKIQQKTNNSKLVKEQKIQQNNNKQPTQNNKRINNSLTDTQDHTIINNQNIQNKKWASNRSHQTLFQQKNLVNLKEKEQDEVIKKRPKLSPGENCNFCQRNEAIQYDSYYSQICQNCLVNGCLAELKSKNCAYNNQANTQIIQDVLKVQMQQKRCLLCLSQKAYKVTIDRNELCHLQSFICGKCQNQQRSHPNLFYTEFQKFISQNKSVQEYICNLINDSCSSVKQPIKQQAISESKMSQWKEMLLDGASFILSQLTNNQQVQVVEEEDNYRMQLQSIMSTKQPQDRDFLVQKLIVKNRFLDCCFKCEDRNVLLFSLNFQNSHINLCIDCIEQDNILNSYENKGLISIFCGLIGEKVILTFDKHHLLSHHLKVKTTCFQCYAHDDFPLEVGNHKYLCYECFSLRSDYWKNDEGLVNFIKKQFAKYQKCLGCIKTLDDNECKIQRPVYLCQTCLRNYQAKDAEGKFLILNDKYKRHFKLKMNEICDYIIDDNENITIITESSLQNDDELSSDSFSNQEKQEISNHQFLYKIRECQKCNIGTLIPENVKSKLKCTCNSTINLINKRNPQGHKISHCIYCNNDFKGGSFQDLANQSLSNKSIIKQWNQNSLMKYYYFKLDIKLITCSECKNLQLMQCSSINVSS